MNATDTTLFTDREAQILTRIADLRCVGKLDEDCCQVCDLMQDGDTNPRSFGNVLGRLVKRGLITLDREIAHMTGSYSETIIDLTPAGKVEVEARIDRLPQEQETCEKCGKSTPITHIISTGTAETGGDYISVCPECAAPVSLDGDIPDYVGGIAVDKDATREARKLGIDIPVAKTERVNGLPCRFCGHPTILADQICGACRNRPVSMQQGKRQIQALKDARHGRATRLDEATQGVQVDFDILIETFTAVIAGKRPRLDLVVASECFETTVKNWNTAHHSLNDLDQTIAALETRGAM